MPVTHKQLDLKVNVDALKSALHKNDHLFGEYPYRGVEGSPHTEMKDIWIRFNDVKPFVESGDFSTIVDEHESIWYPAYYKLPEIQKPLFDVIDAVDGERLGGILITKLPPGGKIQPHRDSGWHAEFYDKYYVPIQNAEGAIFAFNDGVIAPEEGEVFWFDNSNLHWVENNSDIDRIAMIICIKHRSN